MAFLVDTLVSKMLEGMVEMGRQYLTESGFDRWNLKKWNIQSNNENFPELLGLNALLENLLITGASDFVVHQLSFNSQDSKVHFDLSIPQLALSVGKGEVNLNIFGANSTGRAKGKVIICEPRIVGEATISLSEDMNFAIQSVDVQFKLKAIKPKVNVKINDIDYSQIINTFLRKTIPEFIKKNEAQFNEGLSKLILLARK
ncbi:hypothetical protein ABMA27_011505 [Loxostege sticticalis]|uniref:Uncharacterized protein n=1 Tax=Loxostege sticticalis TaxID=481309 RepID=A0ABR3IGK6_LOXSC